MINSLRHGAVAALLLALALCFRADRPSVASARVEAGADRPAAATGAVTAARPRTASPSFCDHDGCRHEGSQPEDRRQVVLSPGRDWHRAAPGETVDLGFRLGGIARGRLISRETLSHGRTSIGIRLPGGYDLHIFSRGDEWEGRALSKTGANGWRLEGRGDQVWMQEVAHEGLICATVGEAGLEVAGLPAPEESPATDEPALPEPEAVAAPILNSRPGANGVIYLDFDGETVSGTQWNSSYNDGQPINAAGSGLTEANIQRIWAGIAEDYRPFNVNITTDRAVYSGYPPNRRAMLVFTTSYEWYTSSTGVGGVAYVDIYGSSFNDSPGWVFTNNLFFNASYCHEAGSHEAGHILGLRHDGTSTVGYYEGHGSGATSWGPIMGTAYTRTVSQWSKGEYADANNTEDDLAIISRAYNGLGYLTDDHSNTARGATPMTEIGSDGIEAAGLIETRSDVDVFSFQTSGGAVTITANNAAVDPNLDIRLRLLDATGAELAVADPANGLDATLNATVSPGLHHVEISGTGTGDPTTGYSDYASLGGYTLSGVAPRVLVLAADILSPSSPQVSLPAGTGLHLDGLTSGAPPSWELVSGPPGASANFSSSGTDSTRVTFSQPGIYRLRLSVTAGSARESDEIEVSVFPQGTIPFFSAVAPGVDLGPDREVHNNRLTLEPVVTDDGRPGPLTYQWQVLAGDGRLSSPSAGNPELVFASPSTTRLRLTVSDGDHRSFAEVGLTGVFSSSTLIAEDALAAATVSDGATFATAWKSPGFDDSGWLRGRLGAGFDANKGPASRRIFLPLIGELDLESRMAGRSAGCLMRVPFEISDPAGVLSLTLRMKFDDGFIAYLNGTEIARMNVAPGEPGPGSLAATDRFNEDALSAVSFPLDPAPGLLVPGTNVLAIHGMNADDRPIRGQSGDTEFLLLPSLEAIVTTLPESPFLAAVSAVADPGLRGEADDPDADGRSNLHEHAAGTDLTTPGDGYPMVGPAGPASVVITLPADRPTDVRYFLEHTGDLTGGWSEIARCEGPGSWLGAAPVSTTPAAEDRELLEFAYPTTGRGFFRLRFERIAR